MKTFKNFCLTESAKYVSVWVWDGEDKIEECSGLVEALGICEDGKSSDGQALNDPMIVIGKPGDNKTYINIGYKKGKLEFLDGAIDGITF